MRGRPRDRRAALGEALASRRPLLGLGAAQVRRMNPLASTEKGHKPAVRLRRRRSLPFAALLARVTGGRSPSPVPRAAPPSMRRCHPARDARPASLHQRRRGRCRPGCGGGGLGPCCSGCIIDPHYSRCDGACWARQCLCRHTHKIRTRDHLCPFTHLSLLISLICDISLAAQS
jgi:hypothetical protein